MMVVCIRTSGYNWLTYFSVNDIDSGKIWGSNCNIDISQPTIYGKEHLKIPILGTVLKANGKYFSA